MSFLQTTPAERTSSATLPPATITTPCIVEYPSVPPPGRTPPANPSQPPPSSFIGWFPLSGATPAERRACLHLRIGPDMTFDYANDPSAPGSAATPLLWLRLAIATAPAAGAPAASRDEFIYLVMPANRFYASPDGAAGSLALTRYDEQPAGWRVPKYVREAMGASAARLSRADMGVLEVGLVRGAMGLVAGRWMRCAGAVGEGLVGDMREVRGCRRLRVHVAWTRELERMVEVLGGRVEEAVGRGDGEEACPLVKGRRVMGCGEGEGVAVNGWGNFLASGSDEVAVVDHKVSSNAERDGLVMTSKEYAEARKRKREEREKTRARKKAKAEKEARADARAVAEAEEREGMSHRHQKKKTVEVFKRMNTADMDTAYD